MAQITNGMRSILSHPYTYNFFQRLMGANSFRKRFVTEFVRCNEGNRIVDLGCGTADILAFLPHVDYQGFDISDDYILAAKKRYGDYGNFQVGILTDNLASEIPKCDIVLVLGVLHHLNNDEVKSLFSVAYSLLKNGGKLVTHDPCYIKNQNPIGRYLVSKDRGTNVRYPEQYEHLASCFSHVKCTVRNRWFPTPYTHCFLECEK